MTASILTLPRPVGEVPASPTPDLWRQRLDQALAHTQSARFRASEIPCEHLGIPGLSDCFPLAGLPRQALSEIHCSGSSTSDPLGSAGVLLLLLPLLARLTSEGRKVALVDFHADIYPPALLNAGVELSQLLLLRPKRRSDALWCTEECARNPAISATIAPLARLRDLDLRRLQLATEEGGGVCAIIRPEREDAGPGTLRLRVSALGSVGIPARDGSGTDIPVCDLFRLQPTQAPAGMPVPLHHHARAPEAARPILIHPNARLPELRPPQSQFLMLEVLRLRGQPTPAPIAIEVNHAHSSKQPALALSARPLAALRADRTGATRAQA